MSIKFAPLDVPFKRRLETLAALYWVSTITLGPFLGVFLTAYVLLFTNFYPIALLYLIWMYLDRDIAHTGGRRFQIMRNLGVWRHFKDFFPLKLVTKSKLPNDKNYLFCVYPHGLLSAGAFGHFLTEATEFKSLLPGLVPYLATLDMHFNTPLFRELMLSIGFVSASKNSIQHVLKSKEKGQVLSLVCGGAAEALYAKPGEYKIVLKKRKGFIKMALKAGAPLVPVFSFGENELYDQVSNPPGSFLFWLQSWLKNHTGIAPCIPIGRGILQYSFGPVPRRCPVTTVIGEPIEVPQQDEPDPETVEKYHAIFTKQLVDLFEENKSKYLKNKAEEAHLVIE